MKLVRIPKGFYIDHDERDLPAPPVVKETKAHYWIDADHEDAAELINDAEFYAHEYGPDGAPITVREAKAFLKAIQR